MKLQNIHLKNQSKTMSFTRNEMRMLHLGDTWGPFTMTKREVHSAQANICYYRSQWPGAEFESKSKPLIRVDNNGKRSKVTGWYEFTVKRVGIGRNVVTGEQESLI